jgi:hypothetical protein
MWRLLAGSMMACLVGGHCVGCSTAANDDTAERAEGTDPSEPSEPARCADPVAVEGCRSNEDCVDGEICRAPPGTSAAVPVQVSLVPCSDDSVCPEEQSCNGTYCVLLHCSQGYPCAENERCGTGFANPNHGCEPKLCSDPGGSPCPSWQQCSPEGLGCLDIRCSTDGDCGCGVCTWFGAVRNGSGHCAPAPGYCGQPDPPLPPG